MGITLYGTETCSTCKIVKKMLDDRKIPYVYIDISKQKIDDILIPTIIAENPTCLSSSEPRIKKFVGLSKELNVFLKSLSNLK